MNIEVSNIFRMRAQYHCKVDWSFFLLVLLCFLSGLFLVFDDGRLFDGLLFLLVLAFRLFLSLSLSISPSLSISFSLSLSICLSLSLSRYLSSSFFCPLSLPWGPGNSWVRPRHLCASSHRFLGDLHTHPTSLQMVQLLERTGSKAPERRFRDSMAKSGLRWP